MNKFFRKFDTIIFVAPWIIFRIFLRIFYFFEFKFKFWIWTGFIPDWTEIGPDRFPPVSFNPGQDRDDDARRAPQPDRGPPPREACALLVGEVCCGLRAGAFFVGLGPRWREVFRLFFTKSKMFRAPWWQVSVSPTWQIGNRPKHSHDLHSSGWQTKFGFIMGTGDHLGRRPDVLCIAKAPTQPTYRVTISEKRDSCCGCRLTTQQLRPIYCWVLPRKLENYRRRWARMFEHSFMRHSRCCWLQQANKTV